MNSMNVVDPPRAAGNRRNASSRPREARDANMLEKARQAGMAVMLDACIGRERFHSVTGTCAALERFARACTQDAPDRATLERWAQLCERGQAREVTHAIRAWLRNACDNAPGEGLPGGDSR